MCDPKENEQEDFDNIFENGTGRSALNYIETDENLNETIIRQTNQRSWLRCELCNVPLSSRSSVLRHVQGKRHQVNVRRIAEKNSGIVHNYYCEICKVKTNSLKQLEDHLKSSKHKGRVEMLERSKDFKSNCVYGILVGSFIFAIILNIFYGMFLYLHSVENAL